MLGSTGLSVLQQLCVMNEESSLSFASWWGRLHILATVATCKFLSITTNSSINLKTPLESMIGTYIFHHISSIYMFISFPSNHHYIIIHKKSPHIIIIIPFNIQLTQVIILVSTLVICKSAMIIREKASYRYLLPTAQSCLILSL